MPVLERRWVLEFQKWLKADPVNVADTRHLCAQAHDELYQEMLDVYDALQRGEDPWQGKDPWGESRTITEELLQPEY